MPTERKTAELPARLRALAEKQRRKPAWRIEDLSVEERAELMAEDRGEGLPVDEAMRDVDRMVGEILAIAGTRAVAAK